MFFHTFPFVLTWAYFVFGFSSATTLPAAYSYPKINLTSKINLAQNINLHNPNQSTYVSMDATDFYVSRLTNKGKLEIFDINTKLLKFNVFASRNFPDPNPVIAYDLVDN